MRHRNLRRNRLNQNEQLTSVTGESPVQIKDITYNYLETVSTKEIARQKTKDIRANGNRAIYRRQQEKYKVYQGPSLKR